MKNHYLRSTILTGLLAGLAACGSDDTDVPQSDPGYGAPAPYTWQIPANFNFQYLDGTGYFLSSPVSITIGSRVLSLPQGQISYQDLFSFMYGLANSCLNACQSQGTNITVQIDTNNIWGYLNYSNFFTGHMSSIESTLRGIIVRDRFGNPMTNLWSLTTGWFYSMQNYYVTYYYNVYSYYLRPYYSYSDYVVIDLGLSNYGNDSGWDFGFYFGYSN